MQALASLALAGATLLAACADPAIDLSLVLPSTQPAGFDVSCVGAVEVAAIGNDTGSVDAVPDVISQCVDLATPPTSLADIKRQIAGRFQLEIPGSGLAGITVRGIQGRCNNQIVFSESIFYGGAPHTGDSIAIPMVPNVSCDKRATYKIRPVDFNVLTTAHTCARPADPNGEVFAGIIRPTMLGPAAERMMFEDGASAATLPAEGMAPIDSFSQSTAKSCVAVGYDANGPDQAGACINTTPPTLCAQPGEVELPVMDATYAASSVDNLLADQHGRPVFGAVFEASGAAVTTKVPLAGATIELGDPSAGLVVYTARGATKLTATPGATATGADGTFVIYISGEPTSIMVTAPGHVAERYLIASNGDLPPTLLAVLPPI